ncbi:hypothetical protein G7Y89_g11749 [Cudoniella acicularis]|uniref:Uncharacterized protein n=1 Tax=Cudoniella acicularis TaxID=354080 RepID=A0A8H4VXQ6_9HELO|nr:hypothetical protein G7Y89_g11749 [Cudoniella acicularis]
MSFGVETLRALEESLTYSSGNPYICKLADGSRFECSVCETHILATATGVQPFLIDIGEQLAWLCAALNWSPSSDKMAFSTVQIAVLQKPDAEPPDTKSQIVHYELSSKLEVLEDDDPAPVASGSCWHLLFENPVIVKGYPIRTRIHDERGLEIPLELMASLGDAFYLTEFNHVPVLKGFSTMFVATATSDNSVTWHFLCNKDGERILYSDSHEYYQDYHGSFTINPHPSADSRNFVGWATSVKRFAGASQVRYNEIDWSRSSYCSAGYALEKMSLNAGKIVTVGATIGLGMRNRRILHLAKRSYREFVKFARQSIYVNVFDVGDRRGWLLDGASTVLHICRTQLTHDCSPHSGNPALSLNKFHHAESDVGADAAVDALLDESNMLLEVSFDPPEIVIEEIIKEDGSTIKTIKKTSKNFLFHELVQRNLSLLEKLHDHQKLLMESSGVDIRRIDREKLEGWDFLEIVSCESSLKPRSEILRPSGRGWVDFTREIHTINLLGRWFGSFIQPPEDGDRLCDGWKQVPKGRDYLTTCVSTVDEICRRYGNSQADPFRLANGINWHKPQLLFEQCHCRPGASVCDRVQVLLPPLSARIRRPEPFAEGRGAVIFGKGKTCVWRHPNRGTPICEMREHSGVQLTDDEPPSSLPRLRILSTVPPADQGSNSSTVSNNTEDAAATTTSQTTPSTSRGLSPIPPLSSHSPSSAVASGSGAFPGAAKYNRSQRSSIKRPPPLNIPSSNDNSPLVEEAQESDGQRGLSTRPRRAIDPPGREWSTARLKSVAAATGNLRGAYAYAAEDSPTFSNDAHVWRLKQN